MSKPRLRFKSHVWSCASQEVSWGFLVWRIGYGYTVADAWQDWLRLGAAA